MPGGAGRCQLNGVSPAGGLLVPPQGEEEEEEEDGRRGCAAPLGG